MPCINTKVNVEISAEKEKILKTKLGKAIEILPGKTENWLMLCFEDKCKLYFNGNNSEPTAFVDVMLLGTTDNEHSNLLTREITDILSNELGISKSRIYIKYEEVKYWGWNGNNF